MINKDDLIKIYDLILEDKELTTKELNNIGFNSNDLTNLVKGGILLRVEIGVYKLKSVVDLFNYGKKLMSDKENKKANICFEKCFMLDPTHLESCFRVFLNSICHKNYERAFLCLDTLLEY